MPKTYISQIIQSEDFIENHLSQCHGAILPREEIVRMFAARINAGNPPRIVSGKYVEVCMNDAGMRSEALLNWFYFFCDKASAGDFSGMWFRSLKKVEKYVDNPVEYGA